MTYTEDFLEALGGWQRGWREQPERKEPLTERILASAIGLPAHARHVDAVCYRKRFMRNADLPGLFLKGVILDGVSSWTTDMNYALKFKGFIREGTFATLFRRAPTIRSSTTTYLDRCPAPGGGRIFGRWQRVVGSN